MAAGVCAVLVLVVAAWYSYLNVTRTAREEAEQWLVGLAKSHAALLAEPFHDLSLQLQDFAKEEAVMQLFLQGNPGLLTQQAEILSSRFEPVLKLRFFLPGNYVVDNSTSPPLGYASVDLLKDAQDSLDTISADVLLFGNADEHIVLVQRVVNKAGELIGVIHLSLDVELFQRALAQIPDTPGYIELRQGSSGQTLVLGNKGDEKSRTGDPVITAVNGTRWTLAYWQGGADEDDGGNMLNITAVLLLLLLGVAAMGIRRNKDKTEKPVAEGIVYTGAIQAIMDGAHPGMAQLIPHLPGIVKKGEMARPVSQGLDGEDITRIAMPGEQGQEPGADVDPEGDSAEAEAEAEADLIDITQAAAAGDFFDITMDEDEESAGETVEETEDLIPRGIFRAYDIRGVAGKELTEESVSKIGQAIGSEAAARGEKAVIVARDGRKSGPELSAALIEGLRAAGRDVIDIGMVPTPVLYFATHFLEPDSGVMVTGSHNPSEYNGLKIVLAGETLSEDGITTIYDRVVEKNMETGQGELQTIDIGADYLRRISDDIPVALGGSFKIVVDCGNGVSGNLAPQLYRALGHDVVELYCDIDGDFPNHHPDPSQPQNLQDMIARVKEEKADLGFAFDGDGDRLGVVDNEGNIIWPDRQMMLLVKDVLSRNAGAEIIFDVKCSRYLKDIIESSGGKPLMWKTGHSLIKRKMKEVDAPLAGEMSGHIFFKERWYGFDDALYTGARMLEVLMSAGGKPAEVFAELPQGVSTPELRVDLPEDEHHGFMEEVQDNVAFEGADLIYIDGLRAEFADGWGLVRPSNTTPCLIVRFEAENQAALERIQGEFHTLMLSIKSDLELPF